ncbi:hypothetical protein HF086_014560 [Spodoptera exigua]|uniref:Elp3/MiaA/NifB-like radical SAM core domain-containing protein n=2 Tax=Spodoptera exigua TaxID=7107 RepID=A0A922M3F2_SPOEX|nr:hypothetical protein HF086_014560 [Spodoptera exigua]
MALDLVSIAQPHYIPGYTGHCPEYKYRIGDTYGSTTHKILLDPSVQHSERLVLSDRTADDFQIYRPPQTDIDVVNARFRNGDPVYKHPMIPGYEGFLPRLHNHFGQRYTVAATEALSEFQRVQLNQRAARNQLERVVDLQAGKGQPWDLVDRFSATAEFKLPLVTVRPECAGILRDVPMDEPKLSPASHSVSPYFLENSHPEKYIKKGFSGHVPYGFQRFVYLFSKKCNKIRNKMAKKKLMPNLSKEEKMVMVISEIIQELLVAHRQGKDVNLNKMKTRISSKYGLGTSPRLVDIIAAVPADAKKILLPKLKAKPIRTASGIAVVAVMCKPHRCPHINFTGNICVYCPGGPDSDFEYSTQSYTGYEPTSMRAIRARYNPYLQTRHRVEQLKQLGHSVDKVEFIVMGGTFMSLPEDYRDYFIRNLHDALSGHTSTCVAEAVKYSEKAKTKCIGITIETRPDYCLQRHMSDMLNYGCTRLEIGVQSVYEDIARDTNRGHTVKAVCENFNLAKDAGYKFIEFFENPAFRADGLKIYPTLVIRGTGLYELWKTGRYRSYPPSTLVDLIAKILALIPPWTRVYRVQRDIPMPLVSSGVEHGNLRELALARMADLGTDCRDVRTREVGIQEIHNRVRPYEVELIRRDYTANGGWETFLAYEDPDQDILVNARDPTKFQHQGFGMLLMEEAERIAKEEHGSDKIAVISGVAHPSFSQPFRPDPPLSINPTEIYHKHVGMLPNYAGHVPGCMFR